MYLFRISVLFLYQTVKIEAEWEIPEELSLPPSWFKRVGGVNGTSGFYEYYPRGFSIAVRNYIDSLNDDMDAVYLHERPAINDPRTNASTCLLPYSSDTSCFIQRNGQVYHGTSVKHFDECLTVNSTYLQLIMPDANGNCMLSSENDLFLTQNLTIHCRKSCSDTDAIMNYANDMLNNLVCVCDDCAAVINNANAENSTRLTLLFSLNDTQLQSVSIASENTSDDEPDDCRILTVHYIIQQASNVLPLSRYELQRGRFHCPSEVTCLKEAWYIVDYALQQETVTCIVAFLIIAGALIRVLDVCTETIF